MLSFLKNHPFAVDAFFESSVVLAFAVPKEDVKAHLPVCLEPDLFEEKHAFVAVALVQTRALRPKGIPEALGNSFFLIGYRVFVRYVNNAGRSMRGLYILKSETNSRRLAFFGNMFTHYNYAVNEISMAKAGNRIEIVSKNSDVRIVVEMDDEAPLPVNSPFQNWKQARKFAGPLPFTFTFNEETRNVTIIEGVRQNWKPQPLEIIEQEIGFLKKFPRAIPANAFIVEQIPYRWEKGVIEKWNG